MEDVRENKHLHILFNPTSLSKNGLKGKEGALIALGLDHFTTEARSSLETCCSVGTCSLSDQADFPVFNTEHEVQHFCGTVQSKHSFLHYPHRVQQERG